MVVCASSPAVVSRYIHLRVGVRVVASQNVTNPALGTSVPDRLNSSETSQQALQEALAAESHLDFRQISVVVSAGTTARHSRPRSLGINYFAVGEAAVVAGNLLASPKTVDALPEGCANSDGRALESHCGTNGEGYDFTGRAPS
jgi:uncharacterized Ntn-hydrolase superfamily protein